jgi:hypothetical protein
MQLCTVHQTTKRPDSTSPRDGQISLKSIRHTATRQFNSNFNQIQVNPLTTQFNPISLNYAKMPDLHIRQFAGDFGKKT